ncbi:glycoside hydrolase family 18 and carbohydrate-binding module family 5 protein [Sanghuangporus baumii]|uniref:chitinase n=1 Tax=Sanghuangporus baumii TaxID=108892 RepID=A0A9Q5I4I6_SANBA|nr:glycoside hydrolase family 18 and carbohydrate-binding module family 5 protein [Sanghuangporus baumii]
MMTFGQLGVKLLVVASLLFTVARASAIPKSDIVDKRAEAKVQTAYFTNWGIYGANFQPTDINVKPLTHILYAFADVRDDGTIFLTDSYADEQKHFTGDSWDEAGNNLYGCLKQLYLLKLANRNLKVTLSIGGWTYSQSGHFNFVTDAAKRTTFVNSAVQIVKDYGFDGIDIDYEYPANAEQGQGFADLLTSVRSAFDELAASNGDSVPYQLTAAVPAGSANYAFLNVPQMDRALTHWNLMAYDYAGSWLDFADHQANLYGGERTNVSTDKAVTFYLENGATASKITMGIPLYGRAFENTDGIGQSYNGIGPGTTEAGIYSYKALPLAGAQVINDMTVVASYSYDLSKRELVSYDTPEIATTKAQYVLSKGLGGQMFWDVSHTKRYRFSLMDKTGSSDSLVSTTANVFVSPTASGITSAATWARILPDLAEEYPLGFQRLYIREVLKFPTPDLAEEYPLGFQRLYIREVLKFPIMDIFGLRSGGRKAIRRAALLTSGPTMVLALN